MEATKININDDSKIEKPKTKILCFNISYFSQTTQFLICCSVVFIFFILYGYMQELIFTLDGFQPYGWYLTLIQFGYYTLFGLVEKHITNNNHRKIPIPTYFILAILTLGTMGLSNASLGYLNYPTQVIFKCCKLIPVLTGSIIIQGKRYGPLDFGAAACMCIGLTLFTLVPGIIKKDRRGKLLSSQLWKSLIFETPTHADSQISPNFNTTGVLMISSALICDAIIGNVQEKSMKQYNASNTEVVLYSYSIGFMYIFVIMLLTGDFFKGMQFCAQHPKKTYGYALLFSLSGYLGIQVVLTLVQTCGAFAAATVTTCRKAVTIVISFLFFSKPFTMQYLWSGILVIIGIYLNIYSKRHPVTVADIKKKSTQLIRTKLKYSNLFNRRSFQIDV